MRLRCPYCKDTTSDHASTFPHCIRCGRQLGECQYCRHFDARASVCRSRHRDRPTPVDPHALPTCGYYLSRLDPANDPFRRALPWVAALALFMTLISVGLYAWSALRTAPQPAQALTLTFVGSQDVSGDAPATFYLTIRNTGRQRIRDLQLRLSAELLGACDVTLVRPPHRSRVFDAAREACTYHFGPLDRGATLQVELAVKPRLERLARVCWNAEACGDAGQVLARTTNVTQITP